jgi:hypothetical protein
MGSLFALISSLEVDTPAERGVEGICFLINVCKKSDQFETSPGEQLSLDKHGENPVKHIW